MNTSNYTFTDFSNALFNLMKQKLKGYSFFAVSKDLLDIAILKPREAENWNRIFKEKNIISVGFIKKKSCQM